jgi:hypothetical protein
MDGIVSSIIEFNSLPKFSYDYFESVVEMDQFVAKHTFIKIFNALHSYYQDLRYVKNHTQHKHALEYI